MTGRSEASMQPQAKMEQNCSTGIAKVTVPNRAEITFSGNGMSMPL